MLDSAINKDSPKKNDSNLCEPFRLRALVATKNHSRLRQLYLKKEGKVIRE
jgi:hypothetical protein